MSGTVLKLKQLLINKYTIYGHLALWLIAKAFLPIKHIDFTKEYIDLLPNAADRLLIYIPLVAFIFAGLYISCNNEKRQRSVWKAFNLTWFLIIGYICSLCLVGVQLYNVTVTPVTLSGSIITAGMIVAGAMAIAYKLREYPKPLAICVGTLASTFVVGFFEIPYQIIRYIHFPDVYTLYNLSNIIMKESIYVIFFIWIAVWLKVRLSKISVWLFVLYVVLWVTWVWYFDYWTVYTYIDGVGVYNEPFNWVAYQMAKSTKAVLILTMLGLNYKNLRSYSVQVCDNKPV